MNSIKVTQEVPMEKVQNLLCSAFDPACDGVGYWCEVEGYKKPKAMKIQSDPKQVFRYMDYPVNVGGAILLSDVEDKDKKYRLGLKEIRSGLQKWASDEEYAGQWSAMMGDNGDIFTADVFVQFCLFGEVLYS